jgi:hypothetical protein
MKRFFILYHRLIGNLMTVSLFSFNYKSHLIVVVAGFVEYSFLALKQHQRHDGTIQKTFHR